MSLKKKEKNDKIGKGKREGPGGTRLGGKLRRKSGATNPSKKVRPGK